MDLTCQLKSWHCSDSYYDKSFFKALMPSMATTYHESSPTSGTGSGIESDGLKVGLDTSTGPYLAKGPNSKVEPNSRVEPDSRMGSMGIKTTGREQDQTSARCQIPTD